MPTLTNAGVRIHYEVEGDGPALVFHTGAGGDHEIWRDAGYLERLPGYRKILIDQRGRGRSDRPEEIEAYRMERFVDDLVAVLDQVRAESAGMWGYSNGMMVGIAFGAAHPERLRCLIGTGAIRWRDLSDLPPPDVDREIREALETGGVSAEVDRRMAAEGDRFPPAVDANVRRGDPLAYARTGIAWMGWHGPKSALSRLHAPLLVLSGEKEDRDRVTEETIAHIPGARLVRIPGVGHLSAFARSDLTVPIARPFLESHLR